jgi:1-acyl-sn-glycerol-3-phosphate acyltransferase
VSLAQKILVPLFRGVTDSIFRVHAGPIAQVPASGPLILMMNHVNMWEVPLIYARLQPRRVHGMVLADRWKNPIIAWGLNACESIPLERGGSNLDSLKQGLEVLNAGRMLLIMPEGTRSGHGCLQAGHPGVLLLALRSGAPILPLVTHGGQGYRANLKRLRRTDFWITLGRPFRLKAPEGGLDSQARKKMVSEIMWQMAACLPPEFRGVYANLDEATQDTLQFCA